MTIMRCASVIASTWSCVTYRLVVRSRRCSFWISKRICTRSLASRLDKRLVEQEHRGLAHDRAAHRHALALPPDSCRGLRARSGPSSRIPAARSTRGLDVVLREAAILRPVRHVVEHAHVRVQRVVLEHHRDVAVLGLELVDHAVADDDLARRDGLRARDHAQERRLAAPEGPTMTMNSPSATLVVTPWITSSSL
jgi:hypothetical protein